MVGDGERELRRRRRRSQKAIPSAAIPHTPPATPTPTPTLAPVERDEDVGEGEEVEEDELCGVVVLEVAEVVVGDADDVVAPTTPAVDGEGDAVAIAATCSMVVGMSLYVVYGPIDEGVSEHDGQHIHFIQMWFAYIQKLAN